METTIQKRKPNVTVNYQKDEDEEYIETDEDLEYSEEEYIDDADEPVDKSEIAWLLQGK